MGLYPSTYRLWLDGVGQSICNFTLSEPLFLIITNMWETLVTGSAKNR